MIAHVVVARLLTLKLRVRVNRWVCMYPFVEAHNYRALFICSLNLIIMT